MSGFGGAVKLTGESEYRAALKKITQNLKEVSSEMKLVSSSYDKNDKSVAALTAKQGALTQKLDQQKSKLDMIKSAYSNMSKQYTDNEAKHKNLVAEYDKEKTKLAEIGKELGTDSKEYQEQQKVVDALAKEVEQSTKAQDANEKALSNMRIEMNKSQADINKTEREMDKLEKELSEATKAEENTAKGADKMDSALKNTKSATDTANGGFTVLKGTLANLAADAISKVIDGLKNLGTTSIEAWKQFDAGTDIIIAKTGASGTAAADLEGVYKSVASKVVASNEEIGTSVGEVSTRFGVQGKDLEGLSTKFLKFAKLNGTDVNASIDNTQKALSAFGLGADDAGHVLDVFNKVGQDTGVSMDTLMSGLIQNGTAFQEMGLSIEDSVALMGQMEKSGANSETVMNGLRKALKNATADGTPLNQALGDLEDSIVNNKNETEGLSKAYDIFGKSGDQIYGALKNGTLSFKDIANASGDFKDSVDTTFESTQDAPEKFALAMQNIKIKMSDLVDNIMEKYEPQIDAALETISKVVDKVFKAVEKGIDFFMKNSDLIIAALAGITAGIAAYLAYTTVLTVMTKGWMALTAVQKAATAAQWALNAAQSANPIGIIIAAVVALVAAFIVLWKRSEKFRNFWKGLWKNIKKAAEPVIKAISDFFIKAWDTIKAVWSKVIAFFQAIWNGIKLVFSGVVLYYKTIFLTAYNVVKTIWNGIVSFFTTVVTGIKTAFSGIVSFFRDTFNNAWNAVKNAFSKVGSWFKTTFDGAVKAIKNAFSGLGKFFSGIWDNVKNAFPNVKAWFGKLFDVMDTIKGKFKGWASYWSGLWDKVKKTFSGLGTKIGDAIGKAVKSGINKVISGAEKAINSAIGLINGAINLINKLPGVSVGKVKKVSFPRLAKGGVLKKGEIGFLEGSGAEAVVPLEKNTQWIGKVADSFRTEFSNFTKQQRATPEKQTTDYDSAVSAFKKALSEVEIILDDETAGRFVEKTVTRYVYSG